MHASNIPPSSPILPDSEDSSANEVIIEMTNSCDFKKEDLVRVHPREIIAGSIRCDFKEDNIVHVHSQADDHDREQFSNLSLEPQLSTVELKEEVPEKKSGCCSYFNRVANGVNRVLFFYPEVSYKRRLVQTLGSAATAYVEENGFDYLFTGILGFCGLEGAGVREVVLTLSIISAVATFFATQSTIGSNMKNAKGHTARLNQLNESQKEDKERIEILTLTVGDLKTEVTQLREVCGSQEAVIKSIIDSTLSESPEQKVNLKASLKSSLFLPAPKAIGKEAAKTSASKTKTQGTGCLEDASECVRSLFDFCKRSN